MGRILYYSIRKALQIVNIGKTLQWGGDYIVRKALQKAEILSLYQRG